MKLPLFTACCTALVTPFLEDKINYPMLQQLITRQQEAGIRAIVIAGTTGEAATLTDAEKLELVRRSKKIAGDDCLIIAGTGSNDTAHAARLSLQAQEAGADALLVVTPYYNKANDDGLYAHYLAVAHSVRIPVIVYNVPSRTGVDMSVEVCRRLSAIPNIAGIKEASPDVRKVSRLIRECGEDFFVWCGNDDLTAAAMALGAKGVISVASNALPMEMQLLAEAALDGDFDTAAALQIELLPLLDLLSCDINPMPIKAAMAAVGYDCGGCRLPLTRLSRNNAEKLGAYFGK